MHNNMSCKQLMTTASSRLFKLIYYELNIFKQVERKHLNNMIMYSSIELAAKYSFMTCARMNFIKAAIFVFFHYKQAVKKKLMVHTYLKTERINYRSCCNDLSRFPIILHCYFMKLITFL